MATDDMPTPALEAAFELRVSTGSLLDVGRLATGGIRKVRTLAGGSFEGHSISARVVAGSETHLQRQDGVTVVELVCLLEAEGEAPIRLIGTGFGSGWDDASDAPQPAYMSVAFEAATGSPHEWLATRVFVAERGAKSDLTSIHLVL